MKCYGIQMHGYFIGKIVSTLPSWTSNDEGKLIYVQDTHAYYYGNNTKWIKIFNDASLAFPLILPNYCSLDSDDNDVSRGSAFNMVETINFGSSSNGAIWFTFHIPLSFDDTNDLNLNMCYNLNGNDNNKIVTIKTEYWIYGNSETPNPSTPDGSNTDNINTGIDQDGKRHFVSLSAIPSSVLATGNTITLKFTRLSSDTYSGTFQMLYAQVTT